MMMLKVHFEQCYNSFNESTTFMSDLNPQNSYLALRRFSLLPLSSSWNSAEHYVFVAFQSTLSGCRGIFLLSALLCSVILSTSGGLPSLNLWGSTLDPPCMFKLLQETELLDLFIQLPRLRRDTQCLQPWPATRWSLWLVCINKKKADH